jgi:hypothetical protein
MTCPVKCVLDTKTKLINFKKAKQSNKVQSAVLLTEIAIGLKEKEALNDLSP